MVSRSLSLANLGGEDAMRQTNSSERCPGSGVGIEDRRFPCQHAGWVAGVEDVDGDLLDVAGGPAAAARLHDQDVGENGVVLAVRPGDELYGLARVDPGRADEVGRQAARARGRNGRVARPGTCSRSPTAASATVSRCCSSRCRRRRWRRRGRRCRRRSVLFGMPSGSPATSLPLPPCR